MKLSEKIQEALRQQQEINLSDPVVQKRLAAQWGYVPADAQPAPSVPEGWKLVPIVSTYDMENAGSDHCDGYMSTAQKIWDAMIAAAPEAKP